MARRSRNRDKQPALVRQEPRQRARTRFLEPRPARSPLDAIGGRFFTPDLSFFSDVPRLDALPRTAPKGRVNAPTITTRATPKRFKAPIAATSSPNLARPGGAHQVRPVSRLSSQHAAAIAAIRAKPRAKLANTKEPAKQSAPLRDPPTCKQRPDNQTRSRGSGQARRAFVPWCDRS